ncbi:hypothetical protein AXW83_03105 [Bosea sp. PAMC 26642]|nr:hypothetical protein AXW83_03105 [Bosea sp. PAMC 26642]
MAAPGRHLARGVFESRMASSFRAQRSGDPETMPEPDDVLLRHGFRIGAAARLVRNDAVGDCGSRVAADGPARNRILKYPDKPLNSLRFYFAGETAVSLA